MGPLPIGTDATRPEPDPERVGRRDHAIGGALAVAVTLAWVALAVWRPTVTYHLAPVFVAAAWPVALRRGAPVRVAAVDARLGAVAGAAVATVATVLLWSADVLRGPTLWDGGHAVVEVIPAIVVGAYGGHRYARCGAPGR